MFSFLLRRLLSIAFVIFATSVLIFAITQIMPGNVAHMMLGEFAPLEQIHDLEERLGLNEPFYVQYWTWARNLLHGDFGNSIVMARPVWPILRDALLNSAILAGTAFVLVAIIGVLLGVVTGVRNGTLFDRSMSFVTYLVLAVPEFFWCVLLIFVFVTLLGWFPATAYPDEGASLWTWISHLVLPVTALVTGLVAHVSRLTRSSMMEVMQSQYIRVARAKGMSERQVVYGHALRNALLPTITVLAIDIGVLMGGIVVVETIFSYPGLGRLMIFSIEQMDIPLLQACMLSLTAIYAVANLLADVLYSILNPKIQLSGAKNV